MTPLEEEAEDFYPTPLRGNFIEIGKNPLTEFEVKILDYTLNWNDDQIGELIKLMIEKGELKETDDGELISVA